MIRPIAARLALLAVAALLGAAACSPKHNVLKPNLPPETTLFIQDTIARANHRVHLYWFGTDPDGNVVGYDMRFISGSGPADPAWTRVPCALPGRCTDSVFTVFTGDSGLVHARFEIRAVDDQGLADPTPAAQGFALTNVAPGVRITNPLRLTDSSFATVTLGWEVNDPDGGGPGLRFRIWLDGNRANYDSTTATIFTVPSKRFLVGGTYLAGPRTVYVQAVDDGGRTGPTDSTSWYVRAPGGIDPATHPGKGRLLVIDDSFSSSFNTNDASVDTLYANVCQRNLPGGFSLIRMQSSNPFRSGADLGQTLREFDGTVWYRGYDTRLTSALQYYQDTVTAFVAGGGRLMLEGVYLVQGFNAPGTLREDFVTGPLNCRGLYRVFDTTVRDSAAAIATVSNDTVRSSIYVSPLHPLNRMRLTVLPSITGQTPGLRGFVPWDTTQVAFWAMPHALTAPTNTEDVAVGMTVDRPGTLGPAPGRLIFLPFPVRAMSPLTGFVPPAQVLKELLFVPPKGLLAP
ncbi:MAG TPA: hypothetical protein VGK89_05725 [Candidatus Eisenbacteria bacterium]|jgi:hypothetical protein